MTLVRVKSTPSCNKYLLHIGCVPGAGDAAGTEAEKLPDLLEPAARGAVQEVTGLGDSTHAMS